GLGKREAFLPHKETQHVSVLPAAEAVEGLRLGVNDKRRVAVLVKRAPGPVVLSAGVKLNVARDKVLDSDGGFEPVNFTVMGGSGDGRLSGWAFGALLVGQGLRCFE